MKEYANICLDLLTVLQKSTFVFDLRKAARQHETRMINAKTWLRWRIWPSRVVESH